jgi:hypothetical protein
LGTYICYKLAFVLHFYSANVLVGTARGMSFEVVAMDGSAEGQKDVKTEGHTD